jgi:hypothetical protein
VEVLVSCSPCCGLLLVYRPQGGGGGGGSAVVTSEPTCATAPCSWLGMRLVVMDALWCCVYSGTSWSLWAMMWPARQGKARP